MPYARLLYHVVWAMKHRLPSITDAREAVIRDSIAATSKEMDLAVYGVGIMPDHVHVFAQVPPALTVARVIGRWKGASSHAVNDLIPDAQDTFAWQEGYGVISVSQPGFDRVLEYVQCQRERHATRELYGVMEQIDDTGGRKDG